MTRSFWVATAGWIGLSARLSCAGATFAAPFTDGCVLQRGVPVSIWGAAAPGETVDVSFGGQKVSTVAGGDGRWQVRLAPMEACSDGRVLTANDCRVKDVLVGEVWLCSGQSNAALPLNGADPRFRDRTGALVAAMTRKPLVRFASTSGEPWCEKPRSTPVRPIAWKTFTPENLGASGAFSALGAYFALEIHAALGVPVGVIGAYQGSSPIEAWIPPEAFASRPELKGYPAFPPVAPDAWTSEMTNSFVRYGGFQQPCVLWNARIAPLVPYTVKGVIWYQGCSNQWNPDRYLDLQHALYESWAKAFGNPNLPFRFVQVASWGWTGGSTVPIQLAQEGFAAEEKNAAMAVIADIGNRSDAHPNEKGLAAKRLAALALARDYGFTDLRADSPTLRTWHAEGDVAVLTFDHARTMYLYNPDNSLSSTFEISGADGKWVAANVLNAETKGTRRGAFSANEIRLNAPGVARPAAVRYLHREPYAGNVFNEMNLPLGAFSAGLKAPAGERLYNGIVLPDAWPPATSTTADAGPQPVPYLEPANIPAVIPIDVGRQLFVDDFLIESTDLERVYGKPRKYEGNPVLKPETPWELNKPFNPMALPKGGGMWWDSNRGVFRLWYESGWCREICYAESKDGLKWERINQDVMPGTNRILPRQRVDSWSVVLDPDAKDPDERWKLFSAFGGNPAKSEVYTSPDGIHWKNHHRTGLNEDRSTMFFNPFRRKWVFSLRSNWRGRSRNYVECDDFIKGAGWHWPFPANKQSWNDKAGFTNTVDCFRWLAADNRDVQTNRKNENRKAQLYSFDAVAYESIMLGAFEVHWGPENHVCEKRGLPKITDIQFAYSRDGFHFSRPLREAAIASERWDAYGKKWDVGYVQPLSNICVVMKDELWFYYGAFGGDTKRLQPSDPAVPGSGNGSLNGMYSNGAMGVAFMRRDGFAAMTAGSAKAGELLTRPVSYRGSRLFVNAAVSGGFVEAEVLDENLDTLAAFGKFCGDSTRVELKALSGSLESLAGRPVRFRFRVKGGGLYSFWVSDSPSGRSHGYLAGGGPGYAGLKDE